MKITVSFFKRIKALDDFKTNNRAISVDTNRIDAASLFTADNELFHNFLLSLGLYILYHYINQKSRKICGKIAFRL
nr:MAG TPA: hypothetical protein [Herelleviridae sp.]